MDLVANIEDTIKVDNVEYESHFDLSEPGRKRSRYCMAFHPSSDYSLEDKTKNRKVNILEVKTLDLQRVIKLLQIKLYTYKNLLIRVWT